jgi:ATP-dependent protease ClpP protease subunit
MNNRQNKQDDDEDKEFTSHEPYLEFYEQSMQVTQLVVPIDEAILGPKYYRRLCQRIDTLGVHDEVKFVINSNGGMMDGLVGILNSINNTEATCIAEITGNCHSAASILALNCAAVKVGAYANRMVHYISFGTGGQGSHVRDMVKHTLDFSERLFRDTYEGFLTDKELEDVIEGKELWFNSEEIAKRLEDRIAFLSSLEDDEVSED